MEQQLCVFACSALGETGGLIFAVLAFAYAWVQRSRRSQAAAQLDVKTAENKTLELERDHFRQLSTRPPAPLPPLPVQLIYTSMPQPSISPPPDLEPPDPDHVDPPTDE